MIWFPKNKSYVAWIKLLKYFENVYFEWNPFMVVFRKNNNVYFALLPDALWATYLYNR